MEKPRAVPSAREESGDAAWRRPAHRFFDTYRAALALHFLDFFAVSTVALVAAQLVMVYRTGVPLAAPPLSVYDTLKHPANTWIVAAVVQPALAMQILLLALLASTRAHGALSETMLLAATVLSYVYTLGHTSQGIAWAGRLAYVLYGLAWGILLNTLRLGTSQWRMTLWAGLYNVGMLCTLVGLGMAPDAAHTPTPIMLYLQISFSQCLFIVPMLSQHHRDLCVVENV